MKVNIQLYNKVIMVVVFEKLVHQVFFATKVTLMSNIEYHRLTVAHWPQSLFHNFDNQVIIYISRAHCPLNLFKGQCEGLSSSKLPAFSVRRAPPCIKQ